MPVLIIITGSNGAGKSSIGPDYIPQRLRNSIFDGDKLFMQKKRELWASGIKSDKECRNLASDIVDEMFEKLVEESINNNADCVYEGHFTNEKSWDVPKRFKSTGYRLHLIFFGLSDVDLSGTRVFGRTLEGGHNVDPFTIKSNFYGNMEKVDKYYSLFNSVRIFDTSGVEHIELVKIKNGVPYSSVASKELPSWFTENLINITAHISIEENNSNL